MNCLKRIEEKYPVVGLDGSPAIQSEIDVVKLARALDEMLGTPCPTTLEHRSAWHWAERVLNEVAGGSDD